MSKIRNRRSAKPHIGLTRCLALALAGALWSCSDAQEARLPVTPVTGRVSVNGEPAVGAQVILHPRGHALPEGRAATATVKADGTFAADLYGDGSGVPAGEYVATINWFKIVETAGGAGRGPNVIPEEYRDPDKSPVKVTVVTGTPTELPPIEISASSRGARN